jgi:hypothetical protein
MRIGSILSNLVLAAWMIISVFPITLSAQELGPQSGERVRLRLSLDGTPPASLQCDGKMTERHQDTLAR